MRLTVTAYWPVGGRRSERDGSVASSSSIVAACHTRASSNAVSGMLRTGGVPPG